MRDPRIDKLAQVMVQYSTKVKAGQLVRITGDPIALPLMEAVYEHVVRAGAHPFFKCAPDSLSEIFYAHASEEQLKYVSPLALAEVKKIDVSIGVWAETNTRRMSRTDPQKQSVASAARKPVFRIFMDRAGKDKLKWVGTLFPTTSSAQDAEMSLRDYEEFVFTAGHLDKPDPVAEWMKIKDRQQKVVDYLNGKKIVRFQTPQGTDLTVNVSSMKWINCCGECNFPDGEVFTGPNLKAKDGGVNGVVHYSYPAVYGGREVNDVVLTFKKGRVIDAMATKNHDYLIKMLDQDKGARNLGEIAIGTNYNIKQFSKNVLFDEKIGGTFHAAVGAGYPETGNKNDSGLHWDMVCDLRQGGTITVDGKVISRDGKFVFKGWPGNE